VTLSATFVVRVTSEYHSVLLPATPVTVSVLFPPTQIPFVLAGYDVVGAAGAAETTMSTYVYSSS
jgi:hypothetical protein